MPDDLRLPSDADGVDDPTASRGGAPEPVREPLDIPEWVSEVRRLYVEPKTRAALRDEGASARHRRLPGIRPSRRTTAASPPARPTDDALRPAVLDEPEHVSPDRLAAAMGVPPAPLTPTRSASATAAVGEAGAVSTDPAPVPAMVSEAVEQAVVDVAPADLVPTAVQGPVPVAAATESLPPPSTNGSSTSTPRSEPWVPPTWTTPSQAGRARAADTADREAADGPSTLAEPGSALARFALAADSAPARERPEQVDAVPPTAPVSAPPVAHALAPAQAVPADPVPADGLTPATQPNVVEAPEPVTTPSAPARDLLGVEPTLTMRVVPVIETETVPTEGDAGGAEHTESAATEDPKPNGGPGRPHTVPAVHLSWRAADSLDLGVPSVDDSQDAIVLEPPSQLVANTRRRSQRRPPEDVEDAEEAAIWAPIARAEGDETEQIESTLVDDGESPATRAATRAVARATAARRARVRRALAIAALVVVALVVGWLAWRGLGSSAAAPGSPGGDQASAASSAAPPGPALLTS